MRAIIGDGEDLMYRIDVGGFKSWMKEEKGIIHRGRGATYAARSLPQYNSAFATRVLQNTCE
jgi:hypothetical protein